MRPILLLWSLLAPASALAADIALSLHESHVLDPQSGVVDITIEDPRVLSAAPIPDGRFHLRAIGQGRTDVIITRSDGTEDTVSCAVSRKGVKGRADHELQRGRSILLEFDEPVRYVGTGNPDVVYAKAFEGDRRFQLVGVSDGLVDVLVVDGEGASRHQLAEVSAQNKLPQREAIRLLRGASTDLLLASRPTSVAISNGQVASAEVVLEDDAYSVRIGAREVGETDLWISTGLDEPARVLMVVVE